MNLEQFAELHRLKLRRDPDDGTTVALGRQGQVFEYSENELGVMYSPGLKNGRGVGSWHPKVWNAFRRQAVSSGLTVRQDGDSEGCLSFDPANTEQAHLALKIARVRPKRVLSPEHKARLIAASPILSGVLKRQKTTISA
jgi:hypothetical protein